MGGLTLRGYRTGDLDAMYALDTICFEKPFRFTRSAMRRFAEAQKARVAIAEERDVFAGFVILHIEQVEKWRFGYIITLDVLPELRRRGIAGALMGEAEQQARVSGCAALVLHVFTGNEAAMMFYANAGFVRSHREEGFYGVGVDAWVYQKLLP